MLILFCISLIVGATLYSVLGLSLVTIAIISIVYGVIFCFITRNKKSLVLGVVIALSVILGALRFWIIPIPDITLGKTAFTGVVRSVDQRLDKTLVVVRSDDKQNDIQITLREKQDLLPGDTVSVRGQVDLPEDFLTDTGRTFDYDNYLASRGIEAVMSRAEIVKLPDHSQNFGLKISRLATIVRFWIAQVLGRYINFPVDGIVAGMLVGFQGAIPKYLSEIFRQTGTLHTLVLSGYNITVLAGFLGLVLKRLPFRLKTILIAVGIILLILISGSGVAAVRAGIMGVIALVASMSLWQYNVFRALILSGLLFFFVSPQTIFVDPGFHLSFLATFFIITILPILNKKFGGPPAGGLQGKVNLRELLILAFGLPIFMLPYMMYFSGLFPWVSPIANIVLVPVIPILMLGGLAVIVSSPLPFIAKIFGAVTTFVGFISIKILTFLSSLPQWQTPAVSGWGVTVIYTILFLIIFRKEIIDYFEQLRNIFQPSQNETEFHMGQADQ